MKNNNNAHISIPGVECGIALMPMKEVYQMMSDDFVNAHNGLVTADSSKAIRHILQEIYEYRVDNRVPENIRHMVEDIKGNVRALHMNDYTRSAMCSDLETLVCALNDAIYEEEKEELVEEARNFFWFMSKHAEEFVDWVHEMKKQP